jgi:hypothetical protein
VIHVNNNTVVTLKIKIKIKINKYCGRTSNFFWLVNYVTVYVQYWLRVWIGSRRDINKSVCSTIRSVLVRFELELDTVETRSLL